MFEQSTRRLLPCLTALAVLAGCGSDGGAAPTERLADSRYAYANACWFIGDGQRFIAADATGYSLVDDQSQAAPLYFKPTALGRYLLQDTESRLLAADASGLSPAESASEAADWVVTLAEGGTVFEAGNGAGRLVITAEGELSVTETPGEGDISALRVPAGGGCTPFPEAGLNATGMTFSGTLADGTVQGFTDTHVHLMAFERLGGQVVHGRPFHPYGVTSALNACTENHGVDGSADFIGNFQREGQPTGSHASDGWPTFSEWPVHDTLSHQQTYYVWLQRAWMAGLRLIVNHFTADEGLCNIAPLKRNSCDEMTSVRLQHQGLLELQDYIDAQAGGPGQGFLRIVTSPAEARSVIEAGQLAVVMGVESSKIFGCGEVMDAPQCTAESMEAAIDEIEGMGIRSIFPSHWFDNAVSGPGLFGPTELALNLFNKLETGHYYRVTQCREPGQGSEQVSGGVFFEGDDPVSQALNEAQALAVPTYPPGPHCNALGLTELGHQMIESLMRRGLLIETDHTSVESKEAIFALAESVGYPLISGHTGTGGITTETQKRRIFVLGGLVSPFNNQAPALIEELLALRDLIGPETFTAAGFASDAGGLASQPAPRADAGDKPLVYPFTSHDGAVRFDRQVTGERVYDLNTDGVAHYGLYPDLLADMAQHPGGEQALEILFGAAEAYLRMWERAEATAADLRGAEAN